MNFFGWIVLMVLLIVAFSAGMVTEVMMMGA